MCRNYFCIKSLFINQLEILSHVVVKQKVEVLQRSYLKGGYLDFSHLTEFEYTYITEIYIEKKYKSSITKNHKITKKKPTTKTKI